MKPITVHSAAGPYAVVCRRGALTRAGELVSALENWTGIFVLSSSRVWKQWGRQVKTAFRGALPVRAILFDDREAAKSVRTAETLWHKLVRAGADRRAVIVAVGGGVVGDVAGFVAACYLRGVGLVQVPTTLVGQVDSAIGGKTGVNLPEGKNLVGAFYPPRLVIVDPETLRTLPARQYRAGLYEVVKYGVIGDEELFRYLEKNIGRLVRRDKEALDWVIPRCAAAKADAVSRDERETGVREKLNFGHTVGHALEAATHYSRFLHGEAVGWGMIAAARLGVESKVFDVAQAERITALVRRIGSLPGLPKLATARLVARMGADKKARGGELRFVLPRCIGRVETVGGLPEGMLLRVLENLSL